MKARGASVAAGAAVVLLACGSCGTETWSFDADAGAGSEAAAPGCTNDTECTPSTLHCDPASGQCVACVNDSQCTQPGLPRCDTALQQCVQCGVTGDCPPGDVCEPSSHTCLVSCADGGVCPAGTQCSQPRAVCVGCGGNADCVNASTGPVCDAASGLCVECTSDSQCSSPKRRCNPADDQCVQCLTNADCGGDPCNLSTYTCVDT